MKKLFLLLSLCCISFAAWADEYTDENGVTWGYWTSSYWDEDSQKEVYYVGINSISGYSSEVVVPNFITIGETNYEVQYIGNTFQEKPDISSITLPSTLKSIVSLAFYYCSSLATINIPEGVTEIGENAFDYCEKLTSITIPRSVTSIGDYAFSGCSSLREVTIPENVTAIGNYAFSGCNSLNIALPVSVKTVGNSAFNGCIVSLNATGPTWLTINANSTYFDGATIVVPDDAYAAYTTSPNWEKYVSNIYAASEMVQYPYTDDNGITWTYCYVLSNSSVRIVKAEGYTTDIDAPATLPWKEQQLPVKAIECSFTNDENIMSVDLSKTSITTMPSFSGCSSLSTISLPSTLESISESAFYNCSNLQSIDLSATKVKEIKNNAFYHCSNLSEITFPAALSTISDWAFDGCKFESLDFSETNLATIGEGAFWGCSLNSVYFPESLEKIGKSAFCDCYELRDVDLSMVKEIEDNAFINIDLGTADISSAEKIGSEAFNRDITFTINATTPATIKANSFSENSKFIVSSNGYDAFCSANIWKNWADNISMYTIGSDNIKWMYRYLADSNSLCITAASGYGKEVTIPSTLPYNGANVAVTQIEHAFNGAEITAVTLPSSLKRIGSYAFSSTKISEIAIPASVESIGAYAFAYCQNLANVALPSSLTILENDV